MVVRGQRWTSVIRVMTPVTRDDPWRPPDVHWQPWWDSHEDLKMQQIKQPEYSDDINGMPLIPLSFWYCTVVVHLYFLEMKYTIDEWDNHPFKRLGLRNKCSPVMLPRGLTSTFNMFPFPIIRNCIKGDEVGFGMPPPSCNHQRWWNQVEF